MFGQQTIFCQIDKLATKQIVIHTTNDQIEDKSHLFQEKKKIWTRKKTLRPLRSTNIAFEISQEKEEEKAVLLDMKGWTKALLMKTKDEEEVDVYRLLITFNAFLENCLLIPLIL